jgi:hypothetical protein
VVLADYGVPNTEVIEKAQALEALLVSLRGDFSDIVRYPSSTFRGIVSVQMKNRPEALDEVQIG